MNGTTLEERSAERAASIRVGKRGYYISRWTEEVAKKLLDGVLYTNLPDYNTFIKEMYGEQELRDDRLTIEWLTQRDSNQLDDLRWKLEMCLERATDEIAMAQSNFRN